MATESIPDRRRVGLLRTGLILAAILGALDIAAGIMQLTGTDLFPLSVAIAMIVLGGVALALAPFAWRGARWAGWTVAATRIASGLTGLPAFFAPGVPVGAVIAASAGLVLGVAVAGLIVLGMGARR